jgi:uncharacterized protein (DUF58 family)
MAFSPQQYLQPEVLSQIDRLDLRAKFLIEGLYSGLHRSPFHGFSVEFSEHRKYTPGDELRLIDWNAWAKTDRYYVKTFRAETNLEAYLLVDCSGSMGYASRPGMTKMEYATCLAAALGHLCISQQDRLGLFVFDDKLRAALPAHATRAHLQRLLTTLAGTKPHGPTRLAENLATIAGRLTRRSMVILLSDLLGDQQAILESLDRFAYGGHDLILMQVLDPAERWLDIDAPGDFEDPETHERFQADPRSLREDYRRRIEAFIDGYRQHCLAVRADFIQVTTDTGFDTALCEFMLQRQGH